MSICLSYLGSCHRFMRAIRQDMLMGCFIMLFCAYCASTVGTFIDWHADMISSSVAAAAFQGRAAIVAEETRK